jgi:hypothetical protein
MGLKKEASIISIHNLIVQADSTVSKNHKVELNVKLKDNTPDLSTQQFSIDKVIVFPNYSIQDVNRENIRSDEHRFASEI